MIKYSQQYIDKNDIKSVKKALKKELITTGDILQKFEKKLAAYCNVKYVVCVSSGTSALMLSSLALLNKKDEVLTTPNSFFATSNSILYAKARPIFVDIDKYANIDLDLCIQELEKNPNIKAIYGVAFSGHMLNQEKLAYIKNTYNVKILEDLAHAIGGVYKNIKAGSCKNSDISIFSFHPLKHITTGEGGAICTNSKAIYRKLLSLRNHSMIKNNNMSPWEYQIKELGFNHRISDINCALGISQLKKLPFFIEKRIALAKKYDKAFKNTIIKPLYTSNKKSSYHLYVILVDFKKLKITKEQLFLEMKKLGITIQLHYMPINKQPLYKDLGYGDEKTPKMDKYYKKCFSIPIHPSLKSKEQEYIIKSLRNILE